MGRFALTDLAKSDIMRIVDYIRPRSPRAARQVRDELREAMRRLADFPGIGHLRADVTDEPVRFWAVHSYLIVYRPETRPLQVVRVLHGARDLPAAIDRPRREAP